VRFYTEDGDWDLAGNLFRLLPAAEKQNLFDNVAGPLSQVSAEIRERMLGNLEKADPAYAAGVKQAIAARNPR
jgi:catalase